MDIYLTDEQEQCRKLVHDFVARDVVPLAPRVDAEERFPVETFRKLAEMGLLGVTVEEKYGGAGADILTAALVIEELAWGCGSTALSWGAHAILCTHNLSKFMNDAQRERFLPDLTSGKRLGAFALTEPNAGSDATALTTKAIRSGEGYVLTGSKMFITNAPVADIFLVFARTSNDGLSAFVVEKTDLIEIGKPLKKLGNRASPTAEVTFHDVRLAKENLLGREGDGIKLLFSALDVERAVLAGIAVGIGQAALDASLRYAKQRHQFGRAIGEFQLVQEMLARMAMDVAAGRALVHRTARLADVGKLTGVDASISKLFVSEMVNRVTQDALQVFGGYGYIREFDVERYHRDARLMSLGAGTSEIQKILIAKELLKR